jgi:hypothetical protein
MQRIKWMVAVKKKQMLSRREFSRLSAALGSSLSAAGTIAATLSSSSALAEAPNSAGRTVKFRDGTIVPALGQGSMRLGQERHAEALRTGIPLGANP